jgi:hypothetical protein
MLRSVARFFSYSQLRALAVLLSAQGIHASPTEVAPLPPPTTPVATQDRTALKHRQPPASYTATVATVQQIVALNLPAGVNTSASIRQSNSPISPYETTVFTVDGDVWLVKMQDNDDDYHLEMSGHGSGPKANRIVVEIPADPVYAKTRRALLSLLPGNYVFRPTMAKNLKTPIHVRVTGYAFFDSAHWTKNDVQGHNHGSAFTATLWEIHPVWKIERVP